MEILLNESSLTAQYNSTEDFIETGVLRILPVFKSLSQEDLIFKKHSFYDNRVTQNKTIHDVLAGAESRTHDELRKFKVYLNHFFEDPYWEDSPKHNPDIEYLHNGTNVSGTSIAEACERDKVIISFTHPDFLNTTLDISKENEIIPIDNLLEQCNYSTLKINRGLIQVFALDDIKRFSRSNLFRQGKTVYREIITGYYWYLDALHKNHYEVFNSNEEHIGVADLKGNIDTSKRVNGRTL